MLHNVNVLSDDAWKFKCFNLINFCHFGGAMPPRKWQQCATVWWVLWCMWLFESSFMEWAQCTETCRSYFCLMCIYKNWSPAGCGFSHPGQLLNFVVTVGQCLLDKFNVCRFTAYNINLSLHFCVKWRRDWTVQGLSRNKLCFWNVIAPFVYVFSEVFPDAVSE